MGASVYNCSPKAPLYKQLMSFKTIFVTVGTTQFDDLIKTMDTETFFSTITQLGCQKLVIQKGSGETYPTLLSSKQYVLSFYPYIFAFVFYSVQRTKSFVLDVFEVKPSLDSYFREADLIISHCGAGTISEVLKLHKPLVVVVNQTLMHNHQIELAKALAEDGHLLSATCDTLFQTLEKVPDTQFKPLPPPKTKEFGRSLLEVVLY